MTAALLYGADGTVAVKAQATKADPDRMQALLVECFGALANLLSEDDVDAMGGPEGLSKLLCVHILEAVGPEAVEARFEGLKIERLPDDGSAPPLQVRREEAVE